MSLLLNQDALDATTADFDIADEILSELASDLSDDLIPTPDDWDDLIAFDPIMDGLTEQPRFAS